MYTKGEDGEPDWGEQCNAMSQIDPQLAKGLGQIQELLSEDNLELLFLINLSNSRETAQFLMHYHNWTVMLVYHGVYV